MPEKRPPKDPNQLAKYILDVTTGDAEKIEPPKKDSAAVEPGRRGGLKSAKTRNERLSPTKRKAIAKKAAKARWASKIGRPVCKVVPHAVPCPPARHRLPVLRI